MAGGKLISTGVEFPDATTQTTSGLPLTGGTMTGDVSLGDNVKATFGAGDDLQIYHDGSKSIISDNGSGNLYIYSDQFIINNYPDTQNMARFVSGGAATLYHAGSAKLATTSTGIDVTGSVTCDGFTSTGIDDNATSTAITIDASENVKLATGSQFQFNNDTFRLRRDVSTGHYHIESDETGSSIIFGTDTGAGVVNHLTIDRYGRGLSQFTAKAWVNINGTGTVAIRDSHNVSSVTDSGTGNYLVNFSNDMGNANYSVSLAVGDVTFAMNHQSYWLNNITTASFRMKNLDDVPANYYDPVVFTAIVFGD